MSLKNNVFWLKQKIARKSQLLEYKNAMANTIATSRELEKINRKKRFDLLIYAKNHSPFYSELYSGFEIREKYLEDPSFWDDIPVLEKSYIKERREDIITRDSRLEQLRKVTTGGSTGKPTVFYRDRRFPDEILQWRLLSRWGLSPSENMLMLWRMTDDYASRINQFKNILIWFPTKKIRIDVSALDDSLMFKLHKIMNETEIGIIWGYVGAVTTFAEFIIRNHLQLRNRPKCVWVTASPVSLGQKNLISKAFHCPVLDQYACSEIHFVASGVPEDDDLVIEQDYRHIDIIDRGDKNITSPEEYGDLLLTDLHNYVFPLIKYRVGDRGAFSTRSWGPNNGFDMIKPVRGRITDSIKTISGIKLNGEYLTTVFDKYTEEISAFQFIQLDISTLDIIVVSSYQGLEGIMASVVQQLSKKVNGSLTIEWRKVPKIDNDRGKVRYVISEVKEEVNS